MKTTGTRRSISAPPTPLTLIATTTGAATVTIQQLTPNEQTTINWGDGTAREVIAANYTGTLPHAYAAAGTYRITVEKASRLSAIDLRDARLGALDTAQLRYSPITYFVVTAITASRINSADMVDWRPANWLLSGMPAGTYAIASADMVDWRPANWYLYSMPAGGSSYTFAASVFRNWTIITTLNCLSLGLAVAVVDTIVADIWAGKATYTAGAPALTIGGTNADPSGAYQAVCPPTSGLERVYDLMNGNCTPAGPEWTVAY